MPFHIEERLFDTVPAAIIPAGGFAVGGLRQDTPYEVLPAVLRLRLMGLLTMRPDWDGVATLSADGVNHWVHISAGEAVSMQGFLTPRLVEDLGGSGMPDAAALADTISRPERLATHLRTADLMQARAAIVGHLVGAELAATRVYWLGQQVAVIKDGRSVYEQALRDQGCDVTAFEAGELDQLGREGRSPA
jgi:2-dehydro-3-deoxygalactonokinase